MEYGVNKTLRGLMVSLSKNMHFNESYDTLQSNTPVPEI